MISIGIIVLMGKIKVMISLSSKEREKRTAHNLVTHLKNVPIYCIPVESVPKLIQSYKMYHFFSVINNDLY